MKVNIQYLFTKVVHFQIKGDLTKNAYATIQTWKMPDLKNSLTAVVTWIQIGDNHSLNFADDFALNANLWQMFCGRDF